MFFFWNFSNQKNKRFPKKNQHKQQQQQQQQQRHKKRWVEKKKWFFSSSSIPPLRLVLLFSSFSSCCWRRSACSVNNPIEKEARTRNTRSNTSWCNLPSFFFPTFLFYKSFFSSSSSSCSYYLPFSFFSPRLLLLVSCLSVWDMKGFPTSEKPFVVRLPKKENIWPFLSLCCCGFGFFFYVSFLGNSIIILLNKKEEKTKINIGTFFSLWYFSSVGSPPCSFSLPKLWWCNDAVGRLEWQAEECQCCYHSRWVGLLLPFSKFKFF